MNNHKTYPVIPIFKDDRVLEEEVNYIDIMDDSHWIVVKKKYTLISDILGVDDIIIDEKLTVIDFCISITKSSLNNLHYSFDNDTENWIYNMCSDSAVFTTIAFRSEEECKELDKYLKSIIKC